MSMSHPSERPARRHPAHGVRSDFDQPLVIFLTVCTHHRQPCLASDTHHQGLLTAWQRADAWHVGRYIVMPDHVHLFCTPGSAPFRPLEHWVRFWKSLFSRSHAQPHRGWQTDHWDTRMRTADQYEEKWLYVRQNPVRAGLVSQANDWPYAGELHRLIW